MNIPGVLNSLPSFDQLRIDRRQAHQATRIENGNASGALTETEASRLAKPTAMIAHAQANVVADGKITVGEAAKLDTLQDAFSALIFFLKHNRGVSTPAEEGTSEPLEPTVDATPPDPIDILV
jgi:hypothetical protein